MSNPNTEITKEQLDKLTDTLHDAEKSRTLEEQVAYLKLQGIDPASTYAKWDDDEKDDDKW